MITYSTPTSPGCSRLFYCLVADRHAAPKAMKRAIDLKPDWLLFQNHFQRNLVLDGDGVFLHGQVRHACTQQLQMPAQKQHVYAARRYNGSLCFQKLSGVPSAIITVQEVAQWAFQDFCSGKQALSIGVYAWLVEH